MDLSSIATKAVSTLPKNTLPCPKNTILQLQCPDVDVRMIML